MLKRQIVALAALILAARGAVAQTPLDSLGDPLPSRAVARLGTLRFKQGPCDLANDVGLAVFSPDGKKIASTERGGKFRVLRDAATGKELYRWTFPAPTSPRHLAFSPDGTALAVSKGRDILLWDVATGKELRTLRGHTDRVVHFVYTDGGKILVSAGSEGTVRWWDVANGKLQRSWRPAAGGSKDTAEGRPYLHRALLAPNGKALLLAWIDGEGPALLSAILYDLASGKESWRTSFKTSSVEFAFAPDGRRLVVHALFEDLQLRDTATGRHLASAPLADWPGERLREALGFSPDGGTVAVASEGDDAALWHLDDTTKLHAIACPRPQTRRPWLHCLAFAPDGKTLLLCRGNTLQLADVATGRERLGWDGHRGPVDHLAFSPDGKQLLTAATNGSHDPEEVLTWDTATW